MLRSAVSKVMWVGRATVFLVALAVILALVFGAATAALAGTGVGATFNLGKKNTVNAISKLVGSTASSMLLVDNNGAGTTLDLRVGSSTTPAADKTVAPMKVDSQAKVANLNADELDGKDQSAFLGKTEKAADSDLLDGQDESAFANATHSHDGGDITSGLVAESRIDGSITRDTEVMERVTQQDGSFSTLDADMLDGKDWTEFVRGNGSTRHGAVTIAPGNSREVLGHVVIFNGITRSPAFQIFYYCPSTLSDNGTLSIMNAGTETLNVFSDNGGANPNAHVQLTHYQQTFSQGAAPTGEHITFQVQGAGMATIEVFSVHRANDCHVQAQGLFTY